MSKKQVIYKNTEKFTPEVIDEILEVKDTFGLTANNLLKKARKKSSSLYQFFDWDDSSAGEKWRLTQARNLINEVKIVVEDKELYAFENVVLNIQDNDAPNKSSIQKSSREYKQIIEIMGNEDYRRQLIKRALVEVTYWKERHSQLVELKSIFDLIDEKSKKW